MNPFLPSLPATAGLSDVLGRYRTIGAPIVQLAEAVMRKESELDFGERELISAYVSSLNTCQYCVDSHMMIAEQFGVNPDLLADLMRSIHTSALEEKLKPIFHYVKKLTETPSKIIASDAHAIYEAGWREETLFDAVCVCAFFCSMNRIVSGIGCSTSVKENRKIENHQNQLITSTTYLEWGQMQGIVRDE